MAKSKNVNLNHQKSEFSSGIQLLRNLVGKISFPRRKQRNTSNYRISHSSTARYRISLDRLRLPK